MSVAELLRSRFEEQGLLQGDCRGFEPHLTIMKLSRASKLRSQVCVVFNKKLLLTTPSALLLLPPLPLSSC